MILKNIHIENYRFYKDFACEFAGNTNLVIGDNGAGKTSLLAAIAQLLSVQISRLGGGFNWKPTDPHTETQKAGDTTLSVRECFPIRISGNLAINSSADINFEIVSIDPTSIEHKGQTDAILKLTEQNESIWPLFSYQRFDRNWKIDKNSAKTLSIETGLNERRDGYKACLTGTGIEDSIQNWCLKMSILEYERHRAVHEFERFKHIIKSFLQAIEDSDDDFEVSYSMEVSGLVMKKAAEIYPLYELSTGYKALLSMIMELAYRSVLLNPSLDTENPSQTGIVIIDEIDAHLHPKWQWRIIDALTKCFPNIQFIIATHSPIVIASAKNARLIDLGQSEQASYPQAVYGKDINAILQSVFSTTDRDNYVAQLFARFSKLLDENEMEATQILDILEKTLGKDDPSVYEARLDLQMKRINVE